MINDHLKDLIKDLPQKPGVYKFLNRSNKIIYIGKAKNLKKELLPILIEVLRMKKQIL